VLLHYIFHIGNWLVRRKREKTKKSIKIEIQKRILNDMALKVFPFNARFQAQNYSKVNHNDPKHFPNLLFTESIFTMQIANKRGVERRLIDETLPVKLPPPPRSSVPK
jgi:hypothetical protein